MYNFRTVAFCPELGLSLLIVNNVHYYLHDSRLVTAVRVNTSHLSQPHSSEPAGRALIVLSFILTNPTPVLLLSALCYSSSIQHLSSIIQLQITLYTPLWSDRARNVNATSSADGKFWHNGGPQDRTNQGFT